MALPCPKCGRDTGDDAVICPGCDFILDSSFLGDDIMDVEADRRPKAKDGSPPARASSSAPSSASSSSPAPQNRNGKRKKPPPPQATEKVLAAPGAPDESWAADALILGDLDDDEVASFHASDTGLAQREVTMARMYVGGSIQALLMPDAIPEIDPELDLASARVTPFERHVLDLVNGRRPVARIKVKARLKEDEFQTALALLADKGFLRLKGRAKRVKKKKKKAPQAFTAERTLIAETPSAHELDDDGGEDEGEAKGFDLDEVRTGPGPKASSDIHREHTLIQPAPRFDDDELGDDDGAARKGAGAVASANDVSEVDEGPLSFADSIISEENVFASAEEVAAKESESASRAPAPKPRAHRRPPLPGELPPGQWPAADVDEPPPAARSRFGHAADDDLADVDAPSDTRRASPASSFRSSPPPLPPDASRETPAAPGIEDEAVAFEELSTGLPTPMAVDAADISLLEVATLPQPVQQGAAPSSSLREGGIVDPPNTDPKVIEVSDFSDPAVKARKPAIPRLPGAGAPPAVPGGRSVPPPRPALPRMMPAVVVRPSPAAARAADKSEEQAAHDSDSGESPVGAAVSFEMLRKAERIFEQAEKDIAAGNASSAIMNVKLALIYNPGEKRYRQFLADWERMQAGEPPKPSKESKLLDDAQEAEQKGDHAKALDLLQKALERAPRNAGLHNRVGVLLATRLKRYKEAAEHVMKAIDLAPGNLAYKNNLGKILAKEESAIHKMPMKKQKKGTGDENRVLVKKLRPKMF